jgi:hypothetical protein
MLKFNRTPSAQTIIDECIFRVFHNQNKWECDSFTTVEQEDIVQRCMNYGVFSKFQSKVLTVKFQNQVWNNLKKNNLGYGDAIPSLRELFYDYQEGIKFSTKYFLAI